MNEIVNYILLIWEYIRNFLDIFIVTFIVYWGYKFLNKTKAISLLRGLIIIFVVAVASQLLKLDTMNWLMANFSSVIIIAVIILFQPELRRLLMQFGQRSWLNNREGKEALHLDELVNAIYAMSATNTGALIVIERNTALNTYAESGVIINAVI